MTQEGTPREERARRTYYDLVGRWNVPIVHMGGLAATDALLQMCQVGEATTALEVGCGAGYTACETAKKYRCQVTGVDYSEEMVARARERAREQNVEDRVVFRVADVFNLPFEDSVFDVAFFESFLNILAGDKQKALDEIARVVRPGGLVGANEVFRSSSTPPEVLRRIEDALRDLPLGPGGDLGTFSPQDWRECFERSGLHVAQAVERPAGRTPLSVKDLVRAMGLIGFLTFSFRGVYDMATNSDLRVATKGGYVVRRMMHADRDTRKCFGYLLIVGKKRG